MSSFQREREERFWNHYLAHLRAQQIKPTLFRWYVRHCEHFIRHFATVRLRDHSVDTLNRYLSDVLASSSNAFKAQAIDSIHLLFLSIGSDLVDKVDWGHWKMSCLALEQSHVSRARNESAQVLVSRKIGPSEPTLPTSELAIEQLIQRVIQAVRVKHYSVRTEQTYVHWIMRHLKYCRNVGASQENDDALVDYLTSLAAEEPVSSATQSIALNAIMFYFKQVLQRQPKDISLFVKAKPRKKVPVVLTQEKVVSMFDQLWGVQHLHSHPQTKHAPI